MNKDASTFFGIILNPGFEYKTLLMDELVITRAIIDPAIEEINKTSRLYVKIDKKRIPICQLFSGESSSCQLNIAIQKGEEISFDVVGDCPVHVSGYYAPMEYDAGRRFITDT